MVHCKAELKGVPLAFLAVTFVAREHIADGFAHANFFGFQGTNVIVRDGQYAILHPTPAGVQSRGLHASRCRPCHVRVFASVHAPFISASDSPANASMRGASSIKLLEGCSRPKRQYLAAASLIKRLMRTTCKFASITTLLFVFPSGRQGVLYVLFLHDDTHVEQTVAQKMSPRGRSLQVMQMALKKPKGVKKFCELVQLT